MFRKVYLDNIVAEFVPEQHPNQHQVRTHQDRQPGHQKLMAGGITRGHIHYHASPRVKLRFKKAENWPAGSLELALKHIRNLPIESGPTGSNR